MKRVVVAGVLVLGLAGCSSGANSSDVEPASTASPTASNTPSGPVVTGVGVYQFEAGGAIGEVTLPGASDPKIAGALKVAKAPAPTYVTVSVDNRQGTADVVLGEVNVYTGAGKKITYLSGTKYLDSIDTDSLSVEDGNKIIEARNELLDPVSIGESRTIPMAGDTPLPKDIVRVTVADAYGDETEAIKK